MLIMFRTRNFNSFKDDVILDLRKTSYTQHPGHTFKCGDYELLKTVAIYGANASGKSNLISAITRFGSDVVNQLYDMDKDFQRSNSRTLISAQPFLLTDKIDNEIEFEMVFYNNGYTFQYGYSIEEKMIKTEWLFVNNEVVFDRANENIEFGDKYKEILDKYNKVKSERLYIGIIDYFVSDESVSKIMKEFSDFFRNKLEVYTNVFLETSVKGFLFNTVSDRKISRNENLREKVTEYVRKIDVGIRNIIIDERSIEVNDEGEKKQIKLSYAMHDVYNDNGKIIDQRPFELKYESSGTICFISIIEEIILMLEKGGVFIVDELSARLHPVITKFIIDLFQSKVNINNAQLIFTSHDTSQMNKEQFRRDEIVLVDKNEQGVSRIYALSDLDVRSDASFDKDYFKGKYGALPIIKDFYDRGDEIDAKIKSKSSKNYWPEKDLYR